MVTDIAMTKCTGLAQTAACCSLRSRRDLYFEIIQIGITRNADTEPRVCASRGDVLARFPILSP